MGAGTVEVTAETLKAAVDKGGIVLVDFWAPWCGPCRSFAPIYEDAAGKHPDITFAKVNTDENQQLAAAFEIRGIPTLMAFRDKVLLFAQAGALPAPALEDLIREVRGADMDEVRKEMAAGGAGKDLEH
jgi:thioredoxin 1